MYATRSYSAQMPWGMPKHEIVDGPKIRNNKPNYVIFTLSWDISEILLKCLFVHKMSKVLYHNSNRIFPTLTVMKCHKTSSHSQSMNLLSRGFPNMTPSAPFTAKFDRQSNHSLPPNLTDNCLTTRKLDRGFILELVQVARSMWGAGTKL